MTPGHTLLGVLLACALFLAPTATQAQATAGPEPRALRGILTNGDCPSVQAVWDAVASVMPEARLAHLGPGDGAIVQDQGESFLVSVGDRHRAYPDAARTCDERARMSAVFIAIAWGLVEPSLEPVPAIAPPSQAAAVAAPWWIELGGTAGHGGDWGQLFGFELRLASRGAPLAVMAGVAGAFGSNRIDDSVELRAQRFSLDAGLRLGHRGRHTLLSAEGSLLAGLLRAEGTNLVRPATATVFDAAFRAAGRGAILLGPRLAVYLDAWLSLHPWPPTLTVNSVGKLESPHVWAGLGTGVSLAMP